MESSNRITNAVDIIDGCAHEYRLSRITEIQNEIARERDKRSILSKKYRRGVRIISVIEGGLVLTSVGLGILSAIIVTPIAMGVLVAGVGVLCMILSQVKNKLALKLGKQEKIKTLAEAKLNAISKYVSKALEDDNISDEEYSLIINELEKFNDMKEEVRSKNKASIDEETKQSFIGRKREDIVQERVR